MAQTKAGVCGTIVGENHVYAVGDSIVSLTRSDGSEAWQSETLSPATAIPAATPDTIYVGTNTESTEETFFAVDTDSGEIRWRVRLGSTAVPTASPATTRPAATTEMVYVGSNRTIHGIDAESGEIQWRETAGGAVGPPVPIGEQLLFTTAESELRSITDGKSSESGDSGENNSGEQEETDEQDDTSQESQGDNDADEESSGSSDDGSGPGFGVPAGLSALGGVGYLLRRRLGRSEE